MPSRRRSISASPARAARATARSMSTWRPTRPNSAAALCRTPAAARRLFDGPHPPLGPYRQPHAAGSPISPRRRPACRPWPNGPAASRPSGACRHSPTQSFTAWFRQRERPIRGAGKRVLLWPDTFNNYFRPDTAIAATRVLEASRLRGRHPTAAAVLRPTALRLGHARRSQGTYGAKRSRRSPMKSPPARRSSAWNRPASAPSATSCPASSRRTSAPSD